MAEGWKSFAARQHQEDILGSSPDSFRVKCTNKSFGSGPLSMPKSSTPFLSNIWNLNLTNSPYGARIYEWQEKPQKLFVTYTAELNIRLQGSLAELRRSLGGGDSNSCSLDRTARASQNSSRVSWVRLKGRVAKWNKRRRRRRGSYFWVCIKCVRRRIPAKPV